MEDCKPYDTVSEELPLVRSGAVAVFPDLARNAGKSLASREAESPRTVTALFFDWQTPLEFMCTKWNSATFTSQKSFLLQRSFGPVAATVNDRQCLLQML